MEINKEYINNRILEMVAQSKNLEAEKAKLTTQGQMLQNRFNQVNQELLKLNLELDILRELESKLKEE